MRFRGVVVRYFIPKGTECARRKAFTVPTDDPNIWEDFVTLKDVWFDESDLNSTANKLKNGRNWFFSLPPAADPYKRLRVLKTRVQMIP